MPVNRRSFLKLSGLSAIPAIVPALPATASGKTAYSPPADNPAVHFVGDGPNYNPAEYIAKLQEINTSSQPIRPDNYGTGGSVEALEKKFVEITGKEQAIFMPSGTMANQLAIRVLSGDNTKVFVQETSHVYRDEADAAQSVHNKRLIPLAREQAGFTVEELQAAVDYHRQGEVFQSGMGVVSIENPVRRAEGKFIPFEDLKKIAAYCRKQGFKLHLDGARLYMASTWSGISIKEYASLFDTVYISLYKYMGATAGAILCGDKAVISKMPHLMKIYGGSMYRNWTNAAMALYTAEGLEARLSQARKRANELITSLNQLPQVKISALPNGTNIHIMELTKDVNSAVFADTLLKEHNIRVARSQSGRFPFIVNETILRQDLTKMTDAFKQAIKSASK